MKGRREMRCLLVVVSLMLIASQAMAAMNWSDDVEAYTPPNWDVQISQDFNYAGWIWHGISGNGCNVLPESYPGWNGQEWLPNPNQARSGGQAIRFTINNGFNSTKVNEFVAYRDFTTGVNPGDLVSGSAWVATIDLGAGAFYGVGTGFGVDPDDRAKLIVSELDSAGNVIVDHTASLGGASWVYGQPNPNPWRQLQVGFTAGAQTVGLRYAVGTYYDNCWNGVGSVNGLWRGSGWATFDDLSLTVPEPGSILALGSGILGLVGFAFRRRS